MMGVSRTSGLVVGLVLVLVLAVVAVLSAGAALGWYDTMPREVEALGQNGKVSDMEALFWVAILKKYKAKLSSKT